MRSKKTRLGILGFVIVVAIVLCITSKISTANENVATITVEELERSLSDDETLITFVNDDISDQEKIDMSLENVSRITIRLYRYDDREYDGYSDDIRDVMNLSTTTYVGSDHYVQPYVVKSSDSIKFICPKCTHELCILNSPVAAAISQFVCPDCGYRSGQIMIKCTTDTDKSADRLLYYTLIGKMDHDIGFEY